MIENVGPYTERNKLCVVDFTKCIYHINNHIQKRCIK